MAYHVAIDLGTSYFRAGLVGGKTVLSEPSAVAHDAYGKTTVGEEAARMFGRHPGSLEVLYPIWAGAIKDYDGTVELLKYIIQKVVPKRAFGGLDITLAVSSELTQVERRALEEAARESGARKVFLHNTLVAAAIGAGLPIDEPLGCLLVNLGAGSTEVALMSLGGIVQCNRLNVGGRTVDQDIVDWVRKEKAFLIGLNTAEQLKRGACDDEDDDSPRTIKGRNLVTGLPEEIEIPDTVVHATFANYYQSIVGLIVQTMEACPPELVGDIMDRGIVLIGGGATEANVLASLTSRAEVPIIVADSPHTCVIRGLMNMQGKLGAMAPEQSGQGAVSVVDKLSSAAKNWVPSGLISKIYKP